MVASMAIVVGPSPGMAEIARMAQEVTEEWLRGFDGYRGVLVFTDEAGEQARIITLWDTAEDELRARPSRATMREHVVAAAGMAVDAVEVYDVPVCDIVTDART
jgi:heme-degrading monooxygenase HmoA